MAYTIIGYIAVFAIFTNFISAAIAFEAKNLEKMKTRDKAIMFWLIIALIAFK